MSQLTPDERNIIIDNPLGEILEAVRDGLRDVEQRPTSNSSGEDKTDPDASDSSTDAPKRPKLFAAAMGRLLAVLSISEAALALASSPGRDSLLSDLGRVRTRLAKGDFDYKQYRPLSQFVLQQACDVDIWNALVALVRALSHVTPPPSAPPSVEGTPITHSSASQQGPEQTRRKVEARLFEEIRFCTHRAVEGFHTKYFEHKSWSKRAEKLWVAVKHRHDGTRWKDLPDVPTQDEVYDWWFDLQQEFLDKTRGAYCKSGFNDMLGHEAKRQLDLFVKDRGKAADTTHDWKDVAVIGELKESKRDWRGTLLQISRYVRDVFAHQPTRRFVPAFTLCQTTLETWIFDRSGPYSAPAFDIHAEPEKFVQIFAGYVMMSDEELGLDTLIECKGDRRFITIPAKDARGKKRKLELGPEALACQRAIVCRGTSCYPAKAARTQEFDSVVKFSWTSDKRPPEADLLQKANERGVQGLARLVAHGEITSIGALRIDMKFGGPHRFRESVSASSSFSQSQPPFSHSFSQLQTLSLTSNSPRKRKSISAASSPGKRSRSNTQQAECQPCEKHIPSIAQAVEGTSLIQRSNEAFDNRILRVLATSPAGRALSQFTSISELLQGLRDAIVVHRSLFTKGMILHRDISVNNIILTGSGGMLIDLDLAKEIGQGSSGARHRTGTMEFMAIQVLEGKAHTYRHDLESFFYVLVWLCARRGWPFAGKTKEKPKKSMLEGWYTGSYDEIARNKSGDMGKGRLEVILREFPPAFDAAKSLCRKVRGVLFPIHEGDIFTGTPQQPQSLYDPIVAAFEETLNVVRKGS